tara:strand:- start:189 stop:632 length:444 start_codon:yes stop_codon:yes gene_type:complete
MCFYVSFTGALGVMAGSRSSNAIGVEEADLASNAPMTQEELGNVFVGIYMVLFALILFLFEMSQLCKCWDAFDNAVKRNFGFLYGQIGKCCYTLFMAILVFGLTEPRDIALSCGIIVGLWGPVQVIYWMRFPDHFDEVVKYQPGKDI